MGIEASLSEQELNYIASGGTTPLDDPTPPAPEVEVKHEPDEPEIATAADDTGTADADVDPSPDTADSEAEPAPADRDKRVPYAALKEEREARKEVTKKLADMQAAHAAYISVADQRMAMLAQAIQQNTAPKPAVQTEPAAPSIPKPAEDFVSALEWTQNRLIERDAQEQERAQQARQRQEEGRKAKEIETYVVGTYRQAAQQYAAQDPSFNDAYNYLMSQRIAELKATGQMSDEQAQQQFMRDEFVFAAESLKARRNPAEGIVSVARARGWNPAPPAPTEQPVAERLDTVARGLAANKSLSSAGTGGQGRGKLDVKSLTDMPEKEFAKLLDNDPEVIRRVMGG